MDSLIERVCVNLFISINFFYIFKILVYIAWAGQIHVTRDIIIHLVYTVHLLKLFIFISSLCNIILHILGSYVHYMIIIL